MSNHQLSLDSSHVPEGYKQTEVGVIPEEWDVQALSEMCVKIQDGTHFSPSLGGNDYLYITSKNIGRGALNIYNAERIDAIQHRAIYSRCDVRKGDLLLTKDGVNTGNAALNHLNEEFSLLSSVAFLRFNTKKYDPSYFLQQILSSDGQNRIKDLMSGNAITRLTLEKIRRVQFSVPPIEEQRAIAQTLSDVDALIAAMDQVIAKKRNIKTATMQELLTGKKRLPGFGEGKSYKNTEVGVIPEDWEVKTYGDIFTFLTTASNPRADLSLDREVEYIHYGDIHTKWDCLLDLRLESLPSISKQKVKRATILEEGDVIMADASEDYEGIGKSVEVINISERHVFAGLHTFLLRDKNQVFTDGYRGYLHRIESVKQSIDRMATGLKVYGISKKNLKNILLPVPGKKEQRSIASILSDMDAEIAALEKRRAKTQAMKQGMMQELLTGKTRLIVPNNP